MSSSGVQVDEGVLEKYAQLKEGAYKWLIFKHSDDFKSIIYESESGEDSRNYADFVRALTESGEPRFAVNKWEKPDKVIYLAWIPDTAKMKLKLIATSSNEELRIRLSPEITVTANQLDDLNEEKINAKLATH